MDLQQFIEFPITIPNQKFVDQIISVASIINILVSLTIGVATDSLLNLCYAFGIQVIILLLIVSPNWWFNSKPPIEWLPVKY